MILDLLKRPRSLALLCMHPAKQLRNAPSRSTWPQQPVRNLRIWKLPEALCQSLKEAEKF